MLALNGLWIYKPIKKSFLKAICSVLKQDGLLSPSKISHDPDVAPQWFLQASLIFSVVISVKSEKSTKSRVSKGSYFLALPVGSELTRQTVINSGVFLALIDPLSLFVDIFFLYSSQEPDFLFPMSIFYKMKINDSSVMMQESLSPLLTQTFLSFTFCSEANFRPKESTPKVTFITFLLLVYLAEMYSKA